MKLQNNNIKVRNRQKLIEKILNSVFKKSVWFTADGSWREYRDTKRGYVYKVTFVWSGEDTPARKRKSAKTFIKTIENVLTTGIEEDAEYDVVTKNGRGN